MAHVKVVRRSMRPEEWTDLRFVWLQRGIYEEKFEITDLEIRDARQISEDQYEYYSDEYRPLKKTICISPQMELPLSAAMCRFQHI